MGSYLNPGSKGFRESLNSEIYIDKTMLIQQTNAVINTRQKFLCVSRPRRFGKSMAADMLAAYYNRGENCAPLFDPFAVAQIESYKKHLNRYDVIKINMQEFLSMTDCVSEMVSMIKNYLIFELTEHFEQVRFRDPHNLIRIMKDIFSGTKHTFIVLIDEWDCLFREYRSDEEAQRQYLDFLRVWLKDQDYIALAYMTGVLPIKKYGSHSALNMFTEYSMTEPGNLAPYFGFTEQEVKRLCADYNMNFEEAQAWYDGYRLVSHTQKGEVCYSIYSPKSIVEAMLRHTFGTYWNQTETYEALKIYIRMDMDGLKNAVVKMLAGEKICLQTGTFVNDMTTFVSKDDVLTLLVHLGYLTYDNRQQMASIPNKEVSQEYVNAIRTMDWHEVIRSIEASKKLLESLWAMDGRAVAEGIDHAHKEFSMLQYNDENALSCTINLAFYFAREYYTMIRELPGGKGFADICLIPRKLHMDKPAVIIELKWDQSAYGAIVQIKDRGYVEALRDYGGNLLLAGINYDKKKKVHTCVIEKMHYFAQH